MPRSLKKGPFVHKSLLKRVQENLDSNKKNVIKTWSRSSMIIPDFVGQTIAVYNGRQFVPCLLYTSPSPRDRTRSRMPSSA